MKSLGRFINRKTLIIIVALIALVSMAPVFYCGLFDYANGDDLIGAAAGHKAFASGATVFEYFKAVMILSIMVGTFISKIFVLMPHPLKHHSIAYA